MMVTYFDILTKLLHIFGGFRLGNHLFMVMQLECRGQILLKEFYKVPTVHAEMYQI